MTVPGLSLPVDDPILIFGIATFVFLSAPLLLQRYRLPGIVGIILVGTAIGPNGLEILERGETIVLLGEVGIVYLMFVAGLEIDLRQFIEYRERSVVFGLLSFVVPQAVGTVVGYWVLGLSLGAAALFAAIFASHTLLAYPIVNRLGIAKAESVTVTIGGTIVTDTLALLVLAVVVAAEVGELGPLFWLELSVGLSLFFVGVWVLVPYVGRWFFRTVHQESYFEFLFVMTILFVSAYLAELAGVEPIIGAFLAGLALNRLIPERGPLMNRIEFVGNALFIPFFLLSVGMLVDVRVVATGLETATIAAAFLVLVVTTKYLAAWATAKLYEYSHEDVMTMFGLSVGQAAAALAIVLIGFEVGLFGEAMLNAVVVMILVVSVLSPTVVDRYGRKLVRVVDRPTTDARETPQRIMVPFSRDSRYSDRLLELALLVRDPAEGQPIYTVTVARSESGVESIETEAAIADIEESLAERGEYGAGAEVPVERRTRVGHNVASGIVNAALENRITTLIIGWDGAPSRRQRTFGDVIDRVLVHSRKLVLVSHVRESLAATGEIVVAFPPGIARNDGIYGVVHAIEQIGAQTGAPVRAIVVEDDPEQLEAVFEQADPAVPVTFERAADWSVLFEVLDEVVADSDLVIAVSARRKTIGWHPELEALPNRISRSTGGNFIVAYPAVVDHGDDRQFLQFE
ncbi:cation:proton antiporter [Natrarchaeobius chitinivorans]|uniref:Cation:proton antiporter n=1 Tax=Natrarchaeobius chitinivorans TaxID=1679083 RepID=A0A3N6N372_NATCH|nr:cation:proton antiporter [Natrarchaeobius chitinivorans]RQG92532.1 cation:proton antiporter [Natrarchaeobius chitinivorans]